MNRVKYPRTSHLPFSLGRTSDDIGLSLHNNLTDKQVVVTIKLDGENTTLYHDGFHARSLDSRHHISRDWLAQFHASFAHDIPEGWRICGENVYAQHSLTYNDLPSYFMGFSVWDENNNALSWESTLETFELLGISPVNTIYKGVFDMKVLENLAKNIDTEKHEGFVVRLAEQFAFTDFSVSVAKFVREKHVQTDKHWMHSAVIANGLK